MILRHPAQSIVIVPAVQVLALRAQMDRQERGAFGGCIKAAGAAYDLLTAAGSETLSPAALDALAYDVAMDARGQASCASST